MSHDAEGRLGGGRGDSRRNGGFAGPDASLFCAASAKISTAAMSSAIGSPRKDNAGKRRRGRRRHNDRVDRRSDCGLRPSCHGRQQSWIVAGGGTRNPTLMRMLARRLAPARIERARRSGVVGGLARGSGFRPPCGALARDCRSTFPWNNGVRSPMTGGSWCGPGKT